MWVRDSSAGIGTLTFVDNSTGMYGGLGHPISDADTSRVQRLAERVNALLLIEAYCRVDFLMDESGEIFCLEANTLPGMTPTSLIPQMAAAEGMDFGELCEKLIAVSEEKYR